MRYTPNGGTNVNFEEILDRPLLVERGYSLGRNHCHIADRRYADLNVGFGGSSSQCSTAALCLMLTVTFQVFGVMCNSAGWHF